MYHYSDYAVYENWSSIEWIFVTAENSQNPLSAQLQPQKQTALKSIFEGS